jgi:hypothetical protein
MAVDVFNRGCHTSSENETSLKNERKEESIGHILHEESVTPLLWYVENENEE